MAQSKVLIVEDDEVFAKLSSIHWHWLAMSGWKQTALKMR